MNLEAYFISMSSNKIEIFLSTSHSVHSINLLIKKETLLFEIESPTYFLRHFLLTSLTVG